MEGAIHSSESHINDSRLTTDVKLTGQLAQDSPRDIEVVPGGRFQHSAHTRFDGSGRLAIERLSLACQSQEPPTAIAFVGPAPDQVATFKSLQEYCERSSARPLCGASGTRKLMTSFPPTSRTSLSDRAADRTARRVEFLSRDCR